MSKPVRNEMIASLDPPPSRWKAKLAELFGIDARSLATFRIALGVLLLADLAGRAGDLRATLLDEGIMPRALLTDWFGGRWRWSLHWLNDSVAYQGALFCLAGLFAVALLLGYRTRLATIASWILISSLHTRAPLIINGGDLLLRILLFWSMFLPLGRAVSLDASRLYRRSARDGKRSLICSVGTVAVLFQVCVVYLSASMFKAMEDWSQNNALHQALAWGAYNKPFGDFLLGYPDVSKALSLATLGLQMVGPLLLFAPWRTAPIRVVVIAAFISFHVGTELSMHLALFSYVSMAALTLFLPSAFWDRPLFRRFGDWLSALRPSRTEPNRELVSEPTRYQRAGGWMASTTCLVCLLFVLTYNVMGLGKRYAQWTIPTELRRVGDITLLTQKWSMFARPAKSTGWFVAKAQLKNGDEVDLLRDGNPVDWTRPLHIAQLSPNHRWRKFRVNLSLYRRPNVSARFQPFRQAYAEYLFRDWNDRHGEQQQIVVLDLVCVSKPVELEETTDTFRATVDVRIRSQSLNIEDTLNFDFP